MIRGINHIGLVVRDIDTSLKLMENMFGAKELKRVIVEGMEQVSSIVQIGDDFFELIAPTHNKGVAGKFLEKKGEGLHHISLKSDDFANDIKEMEENGAIIVNRMVINGVRYAFTHPKSTGGVIYEIVEVF